MKKILAIILSAVMVFSLAACGETEKNCKSCGESISATATFCEHCCFQGLYQLNINNNPRQCYQTFFYGI